MSCFQKLSAVATTLCATTIMAAPTTETIEQTISRAMDEFDVPGMAVSVVYNDEVFYSAGHGILETGKVGRVDDNTLFQIASVSKAFTAAALAILVDDGDIGWDDPVIPGASSSRGGGPCRCRR
jgi:CubicO group peptidase (beta-lactamase class C family)